MPTRATRVVPPTPIVAASSIVVGTVPAGHVWLVYTHEFAQTAGSTGEVHVFLGLVPVLAWKFPMSGGRIVSNTSRIVYMPGDVISAQVVGAGVTGAGIFSIHAADLLL